MFRVRFRASFNTQPPEGGWQKSREASAAADIVSTHSRPKAAGKLLRYQGALQEVSTHSRPKAAGKQTQEPPEIHGVSTHSRPKAAGCRNV